MHEAGIADRVLDVILARVAEAGARRVEAVVIEAGDACGVSLEALDFHWREHARGTVAEGAPLVIVPVPEPEAFRLVAVDVEDAADPYG
jgi:Zn finger protein HypA/HybF involved in hydrogenase expression